MLRILILLSSLLFTRVATAQQSKAITEDSPVTEDGIEYGYAIKNATVREVSNKDFSRYEVTFYASNKSACSRVILFGQNLSLWESENRTLARFDCLNASGARLTSKTAEVSAKAMFVQARVSTRDEKGKPVVETQKVQVGYHLGNGETVEQTVIFIVPLHAKPEIRLRIINSASVL